MQSKQINIPSAADKSQSARNYLPGQSVSRVTDTNNNTGANTNDFASKNYSDSCVQSDWSIKNEEEIANDQIKILPSKRNFKDSYEKMIVSNRTQFKSRASGLDEQNIYEGPITRMKYQKLNKNGSIKLYQLKDEAAKHMTRSTTADLPFHRFYQLKEEEPSNEM
jgi:hypothetical protein